MNTITPGVAATTTDGSSGEDRVSRAARHLYEAECALHIARQSGVDTWIAAAYDHLHSAVIEYEDARAAPALESPAGGALQKGVQSIAGTPARSLDKTDRSTWRFCPRRRTHRRGPSAYSRRSHLGCG